MGGNLLKTWNLPEKRIPTDEYDRINFELQSKFRIDFKCNRPVVGLCMSRAPSIRNKETHGDLDIIIGKYEDENVFMLWKNKQDFGEYLENEFGYKPFKNSNVYSFPYDGFQVDVTFHPMMEFYMAVDYSSWGDLGNIMGRVFHKMGLHFGHSGLSFWIRQGLFDNNLQWSDSDHIYEKVILTNDMKEICEIGGFDYERWYNGFDTEQDAFEFVVQSKYFDLELFQLESLNHTNRTRNRKRGMYMRFIEYVNSNNFLKGKPFKSKHEYSVLMQLKFSVLHRAISGHRLTYEVAKLLKEKINGKLVMQWLGLTEQGGPIVGKIMKEFNTNVGKEILFDMDENDIKMKVQEIYNNIK
jgi:hypothetical protein